MTTRELAEFHAEAYRLFKRLLCEVGYLEFPRPDLLRIDGDIEITPDEHQIIEHLLRSENGSA